MMSNQKVEENNILRARIYKNMEETESQIFAPYQSSIKFTML